MTAPVQVRSYRRRRFKMFYVRGVKKGGDVKDMNALGTGKKDARALFKDKYPKHRIVLLHEKEG